MRESACDNRAEDQPVSLALRAVSDQARGDPYRSGKREHRLSSASNVTIRVVRWVFGWLSFRSIGQ
jgi:hypothetical protein